MTIFSSGYPRISSDHGHPRIAFLYGRSKSRIFGWNLELRISWRVQYLVMLEVIPVGMRIVLDVPYMWLGSIISHQRHMFSWQAQYWVMLKGDSCCSAHCTGHSICDEDQSSAISVIFFSWQAQYLVMLEGDFCCYMHVWRGSNMKVVVPLSFASHTCVCAMYRRFHVLRLNQTCDSQTDFYRVVLCSTE